MKKNYSFGTTDSIQAHIESVHKDLCALNTHKFHNYKPLYEELISAYSGMPNCPAICFKHSGEPVMLQNKYGDKLILLSRNTKTPRRDLKQVINSRHVIPISSLQEQQLNAVWCSAYFYGPWYKTLLALCDYLKIDVPAFYIAAEMPLFAVNLSGAVFPGGDIPYSTDIFVRDQDQPFFLLKTLIHELRHVWQHTNHNEMFIGYSSYNSISDQDAYWKQPSEIDADAFAYWVLEKNGVSFILEDLGQERCRELRTQMQEYEGMEAPELDILHIEEQLA